MEEGGGGFEVSGFSEGGGDSAGTRVPTLSIPAKNLLGGYVLGFIFSSTACFYIHDVCMCVCVCVCERVYIPSTHVFTAQTCS